MESGAVEILKVNEGEQISGRNRVEELPCESSRRKEKESELKSGGRPKVEG